MIIVYDFKVPAKDSEISGSDRNLFVRYFSLTADGFKFALKTGKKVDYLTWQEMPCEINIVKKSTDLRQKEPKIAFKAVIEFAGKTDCGSNAANIADLEILESSFIDFLNNNGIKARKADNAEENLFNDLFKGVGGAKPQDKCNNEKNKPKVLIVGTGPAGIFAAVYLLDNGIKPVLIEKGKTVEGRIKDVEDLLSNARFNRKSNVVFGEGGAGTFSDGKLTTRKDDPLVFYILNFLVKMGAKKDILTEHKPHLGSDNLIHILKEIRSHLIQNGAEIYFEEEMKDFSVSGDGKIRGIMTDKRYFEIDCAILASGSNSYDTYELLKEKKVFMESKPFAAGFRIEHKRDFIDGLFFKGNTLKDGAKLSGVYYNISSKEYGGYSFCMCPGGVVINSSSDENLLCVNGMSYSKRDMENSNSAVVAVIKPEMLDCIGENGYYSEISTLKFRKDLEFKAYEGGGGNFSAPFQYTPDYIEDVSGIRNAGKINSLKRLMANSGISGAKGYEKPVPSYKPSVKYYNLFKLLPGILNLSIAGSLLEFETKFKGFASKSVLTGLETGTSSALRIKRNHNFESVSVKGLYPCGEGSGYSGGIITSAIDGIKCAGAIIDKKY